MKHILTVIGARPQIIKAAAISRAIKNDYSSQIQEHLLHTGQHYDENMSQVFFDELGIPQPEYNLGIGSGSHGEQTARMIVGIEKVLQLSHFDGMILYGDTNSTLAGAIAAVKLHVPIYHIEAGLRSFNMNMPEEVNRILCDRISSLLFAPTETAVHNLLNEGITQDKIVNCGDIMYDNCIHFSILAEQLSHILGKYHLIDNQYFLATVHRDFNTDNEVRLHTIINTLSDIGKRWNMPIVIPVHPRTKSRVLDWPTNLICIPPASFLDMLMLEKHARVILTDSGGVQKEAFFLHRPCIILRPETEWVEITENGAGILVDADAKRMLQACEILMDKTLNFPNLFGDGHAAEYILKKICVFY